MLPTWMTFSRGGLRASQGVGACVVGEDDAVEGVGLADHARGVGADEVPPGEIAAGAIGEIETHAPRLTGDRPPRPEPVDREPLDGGMTAAQVEAVGGRPGIPAVELDHELGVVADGERILAGAGLGVAVDRHRDADRRQGRDRRDGLNPRFRDVERDRVRVRQRPRHLRPLLRREARQRRDPIDDLDRQAERHHRARRRGVGRRVHGDRREKSAVFQRFEMGRSVLSAHRKVSISWSGGRRGSDDAFAPRRMIPSRRVSDNLFPTPHLPTPQPPSPFPQLSHPRGQACYTRKLGPPDQTRERAAAAPLDRETDMKNKSGSAVLRYGVAIVAVILGTAARIVLDPVLVDRLPYATLYLAVLVAAGYAGRGPALLTTGLGAIASSRFFLTPRGSFLVERFEDQAGLVLYLVIGAWISVLGGALRSARRRAEAEAQRAVEQREQLRITLGELENRERQFQMLADSMPQLAWMAEPDGGVDWYNRRWYDYTGTTFEEMKGSGWKSVLDPEVLPSVVERWETSLATSEPFDMVFPIKGKDGAYRPFLTRVAPIKDDQGRAVRWFGTNTDVSEGKRIEEELREARSRLESTLAAGEVGTWEFDPVLNIVKGDPNLARWHGLTPEEAASGDLEAYGRAIHPDDRDRVNDAVVSALETGDAFEVEHRLIGPEGTVRWVVSRGRVERDASGRNLRMPGVMLDVTARKQAEERERRLLIEATHANAKFRAFFDQGALFAGIMDLEGTILESNRLAWEGCGFTRNQITGIPFWEGPWWTPSPVLVETIKGACAQAAAGRPYRSELPYFVADGGRRFVDLIILPIRNDLGDIIFLAPTGTDVTQRRRLEDDLRSLAAELSDADRRKDEFLATLAHELRNPLAPIRNGLEILRMAGDDRDAANEARSLMERQVGHMVRLIDDLMDVSRITRNKLELRRERVA